MIRRKLFVPALEVFPNLARFAPAVNPRTVTSADGLQNQPRLQRGSLLQHLYSDLGVLVYAGANVDQVDHIAKLLEKIVKEGGVQQLAKSKKPGYDRLTTFKLSTGEHHRNQDPRMKRGLISSRGIVHFCREAAQRWSAATLKTLAETRPGFQPVLIRTLSSKRNPERKPGDISHLTVNGRRLLPVEAFVGAGLDVENKRIRLKVKLFTAVTGRFLGVVLFDMVPFSKTDKTHITDDELQVLWQAVPTMTGIKLKTRCNFKSVVGDLQALEKDIWWNRIRADAKEVFEAAFNEDEKRIAAADMAREKRKEEKRKRRKEVKRKKREARKTRKEISSGEEKD